MPEGDTAHRVARSLHRALAGRVLTDFQIRTGTRDVPALTGQTVGRAEAFGKHVFVRVGEWSVHSHMLMDGVWHIYRRGARWRRPGHHARIVLGDRDVQAVGFQVAKVRVVPTTQELRLVSHLGPDPLRPEWDEEQARVAAENLAADTRPIHVALLDQRNVAGFGNVYANELCFLMGVDPRTPAKDTDTRRFVDLGGELMRANLDRVERTTTGNTRAGARLYVYGRPGQECLRCAAPIARTHLGARAGEDRVVFWCPHCQSVGI